MTSRPLVSVIITTYYRNEMLAEAIESVLGQSYTEIEIIVVDDSGEANAATVADDYDVGYREMEEPVGPQAAREAGVDLAAGEFVQFLDDDDVLKETKIERQIDRFGELGDSVGVVYCGYEHYDGSNWVMPDPEARGDVLDRALQARMDPAFTPTILSRRSTIEAIRPFGHAHGADIIGLMIDMALETQFDFVDESLVRVRREAGHASFSDPPSVTDGLKIVIERFEDLYEQTDPKNFQRVMTRYHRQRAAELLSLRIWSAAAVIHAITAIRYDSDTRFKSVAIAGAVLLGRPGLRAGQWAVDTLS